MSRSRNCFYCLLSLLLTTCTYKPEEEFYKDIPTGTGVYEISLNEFAHSDSLTVYQTTEFHYSVDANIGTIQEVEVLLNGTVIHSAYSPNGSFYFYPGNMETGFYELKVQFHASSGTGSLADKAGAEIVEVWKSWVLEVDNDYPETPDLKVEIVDGRAKVSWTPYTKKSFLQYLLNINTPSAGTISRSITSSNITSWVDSSYVGGSAVSYSLRIQNKVGWSQENWASNGFNIEVQSSFNADDSLVTLTWTPTPYSGTFKNYVIAEDGAQHAVITDRNKSSFTFKPHQVGMRYTNYFTLTVQSKNILYDATWSGSTSITQSLGQKMKNRPDVLHYNVDVGKFFGYSNKSGVGWIYKYDAQMNATDSVSFSILSYSIPFEGRYAYYSEKPNVMQLDLETFNKVALVAISSPTGYASGPSLIYGSSLPIVSYSFFGPNPNGSGAEFYGRVYDYANQIFRFSDATLTKASHPLISSDGTYMKLSDNSFYKFNGTSYSLVGTLSGADFLFFRPDVPDEIIASKGSPFVLYVYDADNLALKRTINPLSGIFTNYDPVTKLAIFSGDNSKTIKGVNLDTGAEKVINAYSGYYDTYKMFNGILFTYDGYFIKTF